MQHAARVHPPLPAPAPGNASKITARPGEAPNTGSNNTLRTYAFPYFGSINARKIDTDLVLKALEPIWTTKTETATRVRERIERVLAWATTRDYRDGENPARWTGHIEWLLPAPSKLKKVKHHAALPFREAGAFFQALRKQEGVAVRALEFTILTACRTNEVLGAE